MKAKQLGIELLVVALFACLPAGALAGPGMPTGPSHIVHRPTKSVHYYIPEKFDGRAINKKLAEKIAGSRNLIRWGNCSSYRRRDGTYIQPQSKSQVHGTTPVPCVYLALDQPNAPSEYLVLQDHCRGNESRACLNGYRIGGRVKSTVVDSGNSQVVSTMEISAPKSRKPRRRKARKRVHAMVLQSLGQIQIVSVYANGGMCFTTRVIGADGKTVEETPQACLMPSSGGSRSCAQLGAGFSNYLMQEVENEAKKLPTQAIVNLGAGGALLGALFGGEVDPLQVIATGVAGADLGDRVGHYAADALTSFGFEWAPSAGKAVEELCNLVSHSPPAAHPKGPHGTGNHSGPPKPAGCYKCAPVVTRVPEHMTCRPGTDVDEVCIVTPATTQVNEVCQIDLSGRDTNGDGKCDP